MENEFQFLSNLFHCLKSENTDLTCELKIRQSFSKIRNNEEVCFNFTKLQ